MMPNPISRWWQRYRLERAHAQIDPALWPEICLELPLLDGLDDAARRRLIDTAALFLHQKAFEAAGGAELDLRTCMELALQAALPVLELGLDWYRGWHAVIVYPDEFVPARGAMAEDSLARVDDDHQGRGARGTGPARP
ncbi:zinc-dependent peptidase, partial [Thiohalocapsa sp.]|uniref:zinc-dependent peptidase n=1 Tax=Thiohalocapsa sp. TaxID=2497641 RepID=UPI0025D84C3F